MEKKEICEKIKKVIRKITVISEYGVVSLGTGVVIDSSGLLLTANHVLANYIESPKNKIIVNGIYDVRQVEYKPVLMNISCNVDDTGFVKPITIDLAILAPITKEKVDLFMELNDEIISEGEEVLMAGFPDDIKLPLNFDKSLNFDNPELKKQKNEIEGLIKSSMRLIMIRSGMVGSVQKINMSGKFNMPGISKPIDFNGATYWIDNAVTYGASGGPVVDYSGKLVGIISEKGATAGLSDSEKLVPSGSAMVLSHKLITWYLQ